MKEARVYYTMRFGPLHFYINLVPRSHRVTEQPSGHGGALNEICPFPSPFRKSRSVHK